MTIYTKLDKNGNLVIDRSRGENGKAFGQTVKVYTLEEDPLSWAAEVTKNTDNKNEDFTRKFLEDNKLSFDSMAKVRSWFPYYYVAFLLDVCHCISEAGADSVKQALSEWNEKTFAKNANMKKQLEDFIDSLPDFDGKTEIGTISDAFNPLTSFQFLMIRMEKF